jgi:hypothetical protein
MPTEQEVLQYLVEVRNREQLDALTRSLSDQQAAHRQLKDELDAGRMGQEAYDAAAEASAQEQRRLAAEILATREAMEAQKRAQKEAAQAAREAAAAQAAAAREAAATQKREAREAAAEQKRAANDAAKEQARLAREAAKEQEREAREAADEQSKQARRAATEQEKAAKSAADAIGRAAQRFGQAGMQVGRVTQDFTAGLQYGGLAGAVNAVSNNIEQLVTTLGGGAGLAGALTIAAVAGLELYRHWDDLINLFKESFALPETADSVDTLRDRLNKVNKELGDLRDSTNCGGTRRALRSGSPRRRSGRRRRTGWPPCPAPWTRSGWRRSRRPWPRTAGPGTWSTRSRGRCSPRPPTGPGS